MKKIDNRKLAVISAIFFVIASVMIFMWLEIIPDFGIPTDIKLYASFAFSALALFFLQVLLCRVNKKIKFLPALAVAVVDTWCAVEFALSSGWDSLGWFILLIMCIPLAVGILAGFVYYRFFEYKK